MFHDHGVHLLMRQELTSREERMRSRLQAAFSPSLLEVVDESDLHHGHAGAAPGGETHYRVRIRSDRLATLSRVERHRAVNAALADEFASGLHALSIDAA
jgi:BolA family transcriptional regulator, general stress-responsive regulator